MNHTQGLFRDVGAPSRGMSQEQFLLDTYADRRAEEKPSRAPRWLRAVVTAITG